VLIVGGVLIAVALVVLVVSSVKGGSSVGSAATGSSSTASAHHGATHAKSHPRSSATTQPSTTTASPAETSVAVLNGTETANLAHDVSGNLREDGYTQATPLNGRPPGANEVTVVEYAPGHEAEAQNVARSLAVTHVQPLESGAASLAGSAAVVVIVGLDKAATVP
jgi:hypothetical protein